MSEKMIFCLGDGKWERKGEGYQKNLRVFNQDVSEDEYNSTLKLLRENQIKIQLTKWVDEEDLKDDEKSDLTKKIGGKLKVFSYEEAWATFWNEATQTQKNTILNLKWFNSEIFKGITGIDVTKQQPKEMTVKEISEALGYEVKIVK